MSVTLTSISPASGPPGSLVTALGTGFDAGSQLACPTLVPTTYVSATQLTALIPGDLAGPAGGTMTIGVFVVGSDASISAVQLFTVQFPASRLQTWTSIESVCGEVPGFQRGGQISDAQIQTWIESVGQAVAGVMLRRGLPLDPTAWPDPGPDAFPTAFGLLEMLNRLGAAARLAAAVSSLFSTGGTEISKNLAKAFRDEMDTVASGDYDKLFVTSSTTMEIGQQFGGGGPSVSGSCGHPAFTKEQKF